MGKSKKCVICGFKFDKDFPKDFPDEWKFCCMCLGTARALGREQFKNLSGRVKQVFNFDHAGQRDKFEDYIKKAEKINKLITLNHGRI